MKTIALKLYAFAALLILCSTMFALTIKAQKTEESIEIFSEEALKNLELLTEQIAKNLEPMSVDIINTINQSMASQGLVVLDSTQFNSKLDANQLDEQIIEVSDSLSNTKVRIGRNNIYISSKNGKDTVLIKLKGNTIMKITDENDKNGKIEFGDMAPKEMIKSFSEIQKEKRKKKFEGHYGVFEFGKNSFDNVSYARYAAPNDHFMELNFNKSTEFNFNPIQINLPLQRVKNNFGMITGMGLNWNNYRFDKNITLQKSATDNIESLVLTGNVDKTKLTTLYLTIPLLFEVQFPPRANKKMFISVGGIGAIKLSSHTKTKIDGKKTKDFSDFYLNPFRYGATARVGYDNVSVYCNYYLTEMFRGNKGPEMTPFTIGIALGN